MKSLKAIQVLAKIGKVLSKIIFILCIVGFCFCAVGIVSLAVGLESFKIGDLTVQSIIEDNSGLPVQMMYLYMAVSMIFCVAEAVISKFAEVYFKNEIADGTPFTLRGAKELLRLGIIDIAVSYGAAILCAIGTAIAGQFVSGTEEMQFGGFSSVGIGIAMIIVSVICRYGAEIREEKAEN